MKHARNDYNRFQEPEKLVELLRFFMTPGAEPPAWDPKWKEGEELLAFYDSLPEPKTMIGEDEPVFLLRAKDDLMLQTLEHYEKLARTAGAEDIADAVKKHCAEVFAFGCEHGTKIPDL